MKTLDDAVIELNGVLPDYTSGKYAMAKDALYMPFAKESFICTREPFQQRAKELGFVNGYRWGVEYKTDGKRPDLDGSIRVQWLSGGEWFTSSVEFLDWSNSKPELSVIESFKITDPRHQPADTSYLENPVIIGVDMADAKDQSVEYIHNPDNGADWWDYENDKPISFPPAGAFVSCRKGDAICFVVGLAENGMLCYQIGAEFYVSRDANDFKPKDHDRKAKAERKKVIDAAVDLIEEKELSLHCIFGKLYDKGFLKLPE